MARNGGHKFLARWKGALILESWTQARKPGSFLRVEDYARRTQATGGFRKAEASHGRKPLGRAIGVVSLEKESRRMDESFASRGCCSLYIADGHSEEEIKVLRQRGKIPVRCGKFSHEREFGCHRHRMTPILPILARYLFLLRVSV